MSNRILLVAGVAGGAATLRPFATFLNARGADAIIAPAPLLRLPNVEDEADQLHNLILTQPEDLTIFGYSMGGLIAAVTLDDRRIARRVAHLVTYGTAFDGTLGGWPGWKTLRRIKRIIHAPARHWAFTAVNGRGDWLARFPQQSVPKACAVETLHDHLDLITDSSLHALLANLLLRG